MARWLVKTEPAECGIDDFAAAPDTPIRWDGVRNYQARNFLAAMAEGDEVFVYHASCKDLGIAGVVRVARCAYVDPTQFDPQSPYFDAKSTPDKPLSLKTLDGKHAVVESVASQQAGTRMVNEIKIGFAAYAGEQNLARFDELFLKKGRSYSYVVIPSGAGVRTIAAMNGLDSIK